MFWVLKLYNVSERKIRSLLIGATSTHVPKKIILALHTWERFLFWVLKFNNIGESKKISNQNSEVGLLICFLASVIKGT